MDMGRGRSFHGVRLYTPAPGMPSAGHGDDRTRTRRILSLSPGSQIRSTVDWLARQKFERRGSRLRSQHAVEDAPGIAPVFGPVGRVDVVVHLVVGVHEGDILLDAAGPDPTFVPVLRAAKPRARRPFHRSEVDVVAVADRPNGHRLSRRSIAPQ